jgi:hypothetical protein
MTCPGCGSSLWDGNKCPACGRLGTDLTPRSLGTDLSVPLASISFLSSLLFFGLGVARWFGWIEGESWYWFAGMALFVGGYQGCFVVPALHRRLNAVEMGAGRQVDAHERRLRKLEGVEVADAAPGTSTSSGG